MSVISIAIGSNQGNRELHIGQALESISNQIGMLQQCSPFYENKAQGFDTQELFLNGCIAVETKLDAHQVMAVLKEIESQLGRLKCDGQGYTSRPIDLDIILFENSIIQQQDLHIPHPRFRERIFVLKPLSDIQPHAIDPISSKSISELLSDCTDKSVLTLHELKDYH